ncbi:hypothetical protein Glove_327g60 [Diversispora epigaea]|uniref:DUF659 domain-containing protein n=1 Tax=Diversispora epigaea TaxID=1348612 RepID=A0A397HPE4_9GLOM|nr:hypothetical protein Glove_327g60 [Diversispora epigaea]
MIDSEDKLLISTFNRKRPESDLTNEKKDLHFGAVCKFCKQKWFRRKISEMIAHLILQCPKLSPPKVRTLYLEILNNRSFYKSCFQISKRTTLFTTIINVETTTVIAEMKKKLSNKTNLTLGLDGWTSPASQSLYIFLIMTSDGKEYIHFLKNFSKNSHTREFLKDEIIKIIEEVSVEKFCFIVSDHASNVVLAKNLMSTKYLHIFPIRYIAHHINLLSNDIIKLNWTTNIIICCKKIVTFFKQSHAGVYDYTDSIIRCKNALKQILENEPQLLNLEIISILQKQNFFRNVKDLRTILLPIKKAIINLEHKSTTLADCFINLVIMATAIKELLQTKGREKSTNKLIVQISNYSLKSKPYDFEFVTEIHTVKNWWLMCKQQNNHIQKLTLLMALIVSSNASCEKYFSVLGVYDYTDSIIRCKNALKQILENESQLLNLEIISILRKQNFFRNVKDLRTILLPIKKAIINLEHKSTTLADCFINLVIMATAIKELLQTKGREKSTNKLIVQISNYSLKSKPYDFEFVTEIHTVKNWWLMCKQQNNHIQKLTLLMALIVSSNASCEKYFSVLGGI